MSVAADIASPTIAGHPFVVQDRAGGVLNLRVALGGQRLVALARALAKLDGVRVTGGPESAGRERCFLVHCLGFKMVLSVAAGDDVDFALALVSRAPQAALAVMSDLGGLLERVMSAPPAAPVERVAPKRTSSTMRTSSLRGSKLQQGKPLARRTELRRKTPLSRGPFGRS
ncbi:MAG TPA: hypothetical protein VLA14_17300 [Polyangia bacterium]|jgi:hypothetical protein|nr:hypothetical protein [Polyangia bacterium]